MAGMSFRSPAPIRSTSFAGDTIYAWSEILEKAEIPGRKDVGALRLRTVATKDRNCADFPYQSVDADGRKSYDPAVVLDLDYTVLIPRRIKAASKPSKRPAKSAKKARSGSKGRKRRR